MLTIGDFARLGQVTSRMLRHYDEIGLLTPQQVDPATGYRSYSVHQLGRLHRIVALRDLGFSLDQISSVLADDVSVEELQGMLRLRRVQIEQAIGEEQDRLRRVEAHLRALEGMEHVDVQEIVIKQTQPVRVAQALATGLTHDDIGPAIGRLAPQLIAHLQAAGATPGIAINVFEDDGGNAPEGEIDLRVGFDIGDQSVSDSDTVHVVELPVIEVASGIYRGGDDGIVPAWAELVRWIEDSGYRLTGDCRELYHAWDDDDPAQNITELQQPITR